MSISERLLPEFDQEMAGVRRTLERVPDDRLDWQPHPKSMTMGQLAQHLAMLPTWMAPILKTDEVDVASLEQPAKFTSRAPMLEAFDRGVAEAREALSAASDERLLGAWSARYGEHPIFSGTRLAALRAHGFSHSIHHRAQLGVYLRLNDLPVPALYGPSADER